MPPEKRAPSNSFPLFWSLSGGVLGLILAGCVGWIAAQQAITQQIKRIDDALAHLTTTQTPPTSTVQIVPVQPAVEPAANTWPSVFREERWSPALHVLRRSSAEGFVTKEQSLGTAVSLTSDGWLVIPSVALGTVRVADLSIAWQGRTIPVTRALKDSFTDLVYLKIAATDLPAAALLTQEDVVAGKAVWAEEESNHFIPETLVSLQAEMMNESQSSEKAVRRYAVSQAAVGSAPVWDDQGRLVGMIEATPTNTSRRVLPASSIQAALRSLLANGEIRRASLGVEFLELADMTEQASVRKYPAHGALLIANRRESKAAVNPTGPASKFLKEGDIIEQIERDVLDGVQTISEHIAEYRPGAVVSLSGHRQGLPFQVSVSLGSIVTSEPLK
jgi:S1-C subfamily serine protease